MSDEIGDLFRSWCKLDPFPFTKIEWQQVQDSALALLNATFADDKVLRASLFEDLSAVLDELRMRYGDHPILRETEGDFTDDPLQRVSAYKSAVRAAQPDGLPTLSTRISLARVLLEDFDNPDQAASELSACRSELSAGADESETREWFELMDRCKQRRNV